MLHDHVLVGLIGLAIISIGAFLAWYRRRKNHFRVQRRVAHKGHLWGFQCYLESVGKNVSAMVRGTKRDEVAITGLVQINEHFNIERAIVGNKLTLVLEEIWDK